MVCARICNRLSASRSEEQSTQTIDRHRSSTSSDSRFCSLSLKGSGISLPHVFGIVAFAVPPAMNT
ncbi:hypothetical protein Tco_0403070, partial [Tanacetum coccineum]